METLEGATTALRRLIASSTLRNKTSTNITERNNHPFATSSTSSFYYDILQNIGDSFGFKAVLLVLLRILN